MALISGLTDILTSIKNDIDSAEDSVPETFKIGNAIEDDIVAIDGGSSTLWSNGIRSIGILRYGFVSYSPSFRVNEMHIESKFVYVDAEGTSLDLERHKGEALQIELASGHGSAVLFDGALSKIPDIGMDKIVKKVNERVPVVGVSKKSSLSMLNGRCPDIWTPIGPNSYIALPEEKVKEMVKKRNLLDGATTFYARLHEHGPTLRIDIAGAGADILRSLKHYSAYQLCPGYPFPLAEIHRLVCMDDKRDVYEHVLRKEMEKKGMGKIYLKGKVEGGSAIGGFHSTLDGMV